jgi:hypothetical protein
MGKELTLENARELTGFVGEEGADISAIHLVRLDLTDMEITTAMTRSYNEALDEAVCNTDNMADLAKSICLQVSKIIVLVFIVRKVLVLALEICF